jgi:hypothetical protein
VVIALEDEPGLRRLAVCGLAALMALGYILISLIPFARDFFELQTFNGEMLTAWAAGAATSLILLFAALKLVKRLERRLGTDPT